MTISLKNLLVIFGFLSLSSPAFTQEEADDKDKSFHYVVLRKEIILRACKEAHFTQFGFRLFSSDNQHFKLRGRAFSDEEDILGPAFVLEKKPGTTPLKFDNHFRGTYILTRHIMDSLKIDGTIDLYFSPVQFTGTNGAERKFITYVLYKDPVIIDDANKLLPPGAVGLNPSPPRNR